MSAVIGKIKYIWCQFQSKRYRDGFVASSLSTGVAHQIVALREERGWTQADLASKMGTAQPAVSRIESGAITLPAIRKAAAAFDVAVELRLIPFSELLRNATQRRLDAYIVPFENDAIPEPVASLIVPVRASPSHQNLCWKRSPGGAANAFNRPTISLNCNGGFNDVKIV